jgi:hypothetical protein
VDEGFSLATVDIPKGSVIKITEAPDGTKTTEVTVAEKTQHRVETNTNKVSIAPPRAPDQTVALRKADNAERRFILFASGALLIAALVLTYLKQKTAAAFCGIGAVGAFIAWYVAGDIWVMRGLLAVGAIGVIWWLVNELRDKRVAKETLRRTIATVEELQVDQPAMAKELKEYQEANLDQKHKDLIDEIKPTIDKTYIDKRVKEITQTSPAPSAPEGGGSAGSTVVLSAAPLDRRPKDSS